jgi:hypothetical protein
LKEVNALLEDERGVEPLVMKLMAGIILFAIGLGIGVTIYMRVGSSAGQALSFSVNVSPTSATVGRPPSGENTITANVIVQPVLGYDKQVTLSATGQPGGVSVNFSPSSDTPEFGSTMTVSVISTATPGTITITIRGTGTDSTEKIATFELTIQ